MCSAQSARPAAKHCAARTSRCTCASSAADGYRAVFALAELDPGFRGDVPIITASCDGKALDAKDGPLRLVVPGEKRPARWVRQVTAIDVLRAP